MPSVSASRRRTDGVYVRKRPRSLWLSRRQHFQNRLGLRDQAQLDAFEALITAQRSEEPLPCGRLGSAHYRAIHRHLFQDVFEWAGSWRTLRIAKGGSMFCHPEPIDAEMRKLFARLAGDHFLTGLPVATFAAQARMFWQS
jgi:cell filamentation protein